MSSLISVKNLSRHYGDFCAVNNISFELASGDILGFLGPNGAGKSSTMQMLSGNLAPTMGEISINGADLLESPKVAKASLGYLPENPPLYNDMTVSEYLRFCAQLHAINKRQVSQACDSAIEHCALEKVRKKIIGNLSKGYQQRVGIAQAILHSPPVIILDEPTVGLDPIQIIEIRKLIKNLGKNHGIILCTHILPEVQAVCNRVQIMNNGELVYTANIEKILNSSTLKFELTLSSEVTLETLSSHTIFTRVEKTEKNNFVVESESNAEQLINYVVQHKWGLTKFNPYQTSLEQIFIDLTLADNNSRSKTNEINSTENNKQ